MADRDRHPTERLTLTELHQLGTWPIAVAALDALGPDWVLIFRRGILAEIRSITISLESEAYPPVLIDRLDRLVRALRHLGHDPTLAVPTSEPPAATPIPEPEQP